MKINDQSHSTERTLGEWLSYLESLHPTEIDLGLTRISQVAEKLAIDFSFAKVITVAGTNGKGTTCAFLENALLSEGKTVAVYSSPHIELFNERLRINKVDVCDQPLIDAFAKIEAARQDISLTYYEYTTLAAFLVLQDIQPEVIILEVGLGGRLDATNIIDADVAVITTVDLDHQAFLGNTRELIGFEKAGIMRRGQIVVVGDLAPPTSVINHAQQLNAKLFCRNDYFNVSGNIDRWQFKTSQHTLSGLIKPNIPQANVATALTVLEQLNIEINSDKANLWLKNTKVPGRTEYFTFAGKQVMLDVAHNPEAARYLANYLQNHRYRQVIAVVGMLADKDIKNSLAPMLPLVNHWYLATVDAHRAEKAENIVKYLNQTAQCFDNVTEAFNIAITQAETDDLVVVFGSFYTVSEIRRLLV